MLLVQLEDDCTTQEDKAMSPAAVSTSEGIAPIQRLADDRWLCTINMQGISTTIGEEPTRELALQTYERLVVETRATKRALGGLYKLASTLREDQRVSDARVLQEAVQLCHPRISAQRLQDSVSLNGPSSTTTAALAAASGKREIKETTNLTSELPRKPSASRGFEKTAPVTPAHAVTSALSLSRSVSSSSTCLSPSRLPSNTAGSLSSSPATSNSSWRNPKRKKPVQRLAFLRLRRLIQKRLCHHLEGQEVCVQVRTDAADVEEDKISWTATGRLEAGHVFSFRQGRRLTFADYVNDEIHRPVSACPHMFLVSERESIDDHLAVCDVFTEADRRKLGADFMGSMQSYMKMKDKRSSNKL